MSFKSFLGEFYINSFDFLLTDYKTFSKF